MKKKFIKTDHRKRQNRIKIVKICIKIVDVLDAVQTLIAAVTEFSGGVLIVSHDAHLLQCTCDEIWHVKRGMVEKFKGSIDEFKGVLLKENKKALEEAAKQK